MGLRINTNTAALNAQYQLRANTKGVATAMERLSSGHRINRASDDAAGLASSELMKANIRGLQQIDRNTQDGISLTQIAEGSLNQIGNIISRLRELSLQAASDTVSDSDRALIGREYSQMLQEVDRIANTTVYNGTKLLTGTGGTIDFQINTRNQASVDRISFDSSEADVRTSALGIAHTDVSDKYMAQDAIGRLDEAMTAISSLRAGIGAIQSRLITTAENMTSNIENIAAANSRVRDTDIAEESSMLAKNNIMLQAATSILAQANQQPGQALALLNKG
ncbi:flagellin [Pseudobdellovibrio exovorus]|uniref:Flagellin n=1 Tax=Pseudobdellovibrio exovorus JSS TaxID=1184267 RepID=M4VD50_9BACT|nr:flagellin [Pseudobdellovibrio exovorus]AGH96415.1 flagellin [Pseudobdellovibrio exovorus JSS]